MPWWISQQPPQNYRCTHHSVILTQYPQQKIFYHHLNSTNLFLSPTKCPCVISLFSPFFSLLDCIQATYVNPPHKTVQSKNMSTWQRERKIQAKQPFFAFTASTHLCTGNKHLDQTSPPGQTSHLALNTMSTLFSRGTKSKQQKHSRNAISHRKIYIFCQELNCSEKCMTASLPDVMFSSTSVVFFFFRHHHHDHHHIVIITREQLQLVWIVYIISYHNVAICSDI